MKNSQVKVGDTVQTIIGNSNDIFTGTVKNITRRRGGMVFVQTEKIVQPKTISAFCDTCDAQASGTKEQLQSDGWGIFPTCQFCSHCND